MKSFNEHTNVKREELKEDPFDDLTDLLWVAAAGAGVWGLSKGWDRFGKDAVASLPFATKGMKAGKIDRAKERKDKKVEIAKKIADDPKSSEKDKKKAEKDLDKLLSPVEKAERATEKGEKEKGDTEKIEKGKVATGEYSTDKNGIIDNQADAQKYKDATGGAPEGWATSDGKTPDGATPKPPKDTVWSKEDEEKWTEDEAKRKEAEAAKTTDPPEETNKPKGTKMTITESNELQAIMALDDAGIKAEINRKGQVVIKKKDKKKAHIALEKSFKKGGWPPLKLEGVDEHKGTEPHKHPHEDEELDEASSKKARNKAADEIEAIADKGGAEAPALFSLASKLRKGTHSTTGLKLSKKVTAILKINGIKEDVQKQRTAYEVVSKARNRVVKNKPEWETENSRLS